MSQGSWDCFVRLQSRVAWLVWVRLVCPGAPCDSLGVIFCLTGGYGFALCVAWFFWVRLVSLGTIGISGFLRVHLVCPDALWGSQGSFGFVWIVHVRTMGRWVGSGSSGSCRCAWGVAGFFRARLVRPGAP